MPPADEWLQALTAAHTEREVLAVVDDYLRRWPSTELSHIPRDCRPGRVRSGVELQEKALRLARAHLSWHGGVHAELRIERMAMFFSMAANRLSQVLTPQPDPVVDIPAAKR